MVAKTINLENVGPIKALRVPVPEGGGVVVLRGPNGSGKTHGVRAVEAMVNPGVRRELRASDGVPSGKIDGFGLTIRLGRSNTVRGELEAHSLDASCDPSVLVDPGLKDSDAADRKRLGTLIRLAGIRLTAEDWAEMFHGVDELREHVDLDAMAGDDPVQTADRIRRRLHDIALKQERLGQTADSEAEGMMRTVAEVDLSAEADETAIRGRISSLSEKLVLAKQRREQAAKAKQMVDQAQKELAYEQHTGPTLGDAEQRKQRASEAVENAKRFVEAGRALVAQAQKELAEAEHRSKLADAELRHADEALLQAQRREEKREKLSEILRTSIPHCPSEDDLTEIAKGLEEAQAELSYCGIVKQALARRQQADELKDRANDFAQRAEKLRDLARSTDGVLENALERAGFCRVKVHDGRLCVESDRGLEPVSDLSHGERWKLALDLAASGLGAGGLLAVCQEAWESLDPDNRRFVAGLAKARGLVIVTAEATDGELRAEEFTEAA